MELKVNKFGPYSVNFTSPIFIEDGDRISLIYDFKTNILLAKGKNYGNYIFWQEAKRIKEKSFDSATYTSDMMRLKAELLDTYKAKKNILDSFWKKRIISPTFFEYANTELFYSYLFILKSYPGRFKIKKSNLPPRYMEEFIQENFYKMHALQSMSYSFMIVYYSSNILTPLAASGQYDSSHLMQCFKNVCRVFSGQQKDFILSFIFKQYCLRQSFGYTKALDEYYSMALMEIKEKDYLEHMRNFLTAYKMVNRPLPVSMLNLVLKSSDGDTTYLSSLLAKYNNLQTTYLDFWASWCAPCIDGIKKYNFSREANDERANFIFLSIDTDFDKFSAAVKKYRITAFQILNRGDSIVENFFQSGAIPQTLLLEKGIIKNTNVNLMQTFGN